MDVFRMKHYLQTTKDAAIEVGDKTYRTGKTCRNGHEAIRNISGKCTQCSSEIVRKQNLAKQPSRMLDIDHLLGLKRDEKEFLDPYYYLNEDF